MWVQRVLNRLGKGHHTKFTVRAAKSRVRRLTAATVEQLEDRRLLSINQEIPSTLLGHDVVQMNWFGQDVPVLAGRWLLGMNNLSGSREQQATQGQAALSAVVGTPALTVEQALVGGNILVVETAPTATYGELYQALHTLPGFAYLEPDMVLTAAVTPNDAGFNNLWGMHNTGQSQGIPDKDIDAPEAWDLITNANSSVIAVIDTGIDYNHPDLAANMWTNPGETPGDNIDNDNNGFVDDVYGYDFANNDNNPIDDNNHGTHCAGTIGGVGNNGIGVAGVAWNTKLMALKFLTAGGSGSTSGAVNSVNYATLMRNAGVNVRVTSNSWGGGGFSTSLYNSIAASGNAGMLFVAAAGNNNSNNDQSPFYPASYDNDNLISVAASDRFDARASFSNYGATSVDLAAPGVTIYSTVVGGGYANFNGTSMACPHVAGVANVAFAYKPNATWSEIKGAILQGVDPVAAFATNTLTGGRLNLKRTLDILDVDSTTPDGYDYYATNHPFEAIDLAPGGAGVLTVLDGVNDGTAAVDLGSNTFNMYGTTYTGATSLFVSSNGLITFGSGNSSPAITDLTAAPSQAAIAPLWGDWRTEFGTQDQVLALFQDLNSDSVMDRLVLEWNAVPHVFGISTNPATFQAILELNTGSGTGEIIFNYPDLFVGRSAYDSGRFSTIGIKDAGTQGTFRTLVSYNKSHTWVGSGEAIRIDRDVNDIQLNSVTTDGHSAVTLNYEIIGGAVSPFDIGVYRSADRSAGADTLVGTYTISNAADLTPGSHSVVVNAGSGSGEIPLPGAGAADVLSDYFLLFVADPTDAIAEVDADPLAEDNTAVFEGAYQAAGERVIVHGTAGDDNIHYEGSGDVTLDINGNTTVYTAGSVPGFTIRSHEGDDVVDSFGYAYALNAFGGLDVDLLVGSPLEDHLDAGFGAGDSSANTVGGGAGNDTIIGTNGPDFLFGDAGNDLLYGHNHTDWMFGGSENDTLFGGDLDDYMHGNEGSDTLTGDAGIDFYQLDGTAAADTISITKAAGASPVLGKVGGDTDTYNIETHDRLAVFGYGGKDKITVAATIAMGTSLYGGDENDTLQGGAGIDLLDGGNGNDTFKAKAGNDTILGGAGMDSYSMEGTSASEQFDADYDGSSLIVRRMLNGVDPVESDTVQAVEKINVLGAAGNDLLDFSMLSAADIAALAITSVLLDGGTGNDTLLGSQGNDTLKGGDGNDLIQGNDGVDTWQYLAKTTNDDLFLGLLAADQMQLTRRLVGNAAVLETDTFIFAANDKVLLQASTGNDLITVDSALTVPGVIAYGMVDGGIGTDQATVPAGWLKKYVEL